MDEAAGPVYLSLIYNLKTLLPLGQDSRFFGPGYENLYFQCYGELVHPSLKFIRELKSTRKSLCYWPVLLASIKSILYLLTELGPAKSP